ncbi:MAG: hypothetical protein COA78_08915 [Blastopirellula sp.]|nr:MAG: hypothetical protein COA78_08915 [Blastopirellula sp.]
MGNRLQKYRGCLLAVALGDVIGSKYEWMSSRDLNSQFKTPLDVIHGTSLKEDAYYTDDTQMTICVAESLLKDGRINRENLAQNFSESYDTWRGYGAGTRAVLNAIYTGATVEDASVAEFSEGSYGNGAAMRVAPLGLYFPKNQELLRSAVHDASSITHCHRHGIEGAQIMANAISYMVRVKQFEIDEYWKVITNAVESNNFRLKIDQAMSLSSLDDLIEYGSDISALDSVPTALACAAIHHNCLLTAIGTAILIGGDTDTVASMTGALVGALVGDHAIPETFIKAVDRDNKKGATYLITLADELEKASNKQ